MRKKHYEITGIDRVIGEQFDKKPRLLLHACCGPCATSVLERLTPYFDVTVYFYNPNIMPKEEFILRLDTLKSVIAHFDDVKLIVPDQDEIDYLPLVVGHEEEREGGARCSICFALRLDNTAKYLSSHKGEFDYFATTLTVSRRKNAQLINEIGEQISKKYGVTYLSSDFKKLGGENRSTELCKEWNIYRQHYCGCCYSASAKIEKTQ